MWQRLLDVMQEGNFVMLAEKFILFLESLIRSESRGYPDGSPRVLSTSTFVPINRPAQSE
jgi:hypothetical protein